jgi:hypothetical protein
MSTTLSSSVSPSSSPIVPKRVNNIFGTELGELPSAILTKRKNRINKDNNIINNVINVINNMDNNNNNNNNINININPTLVETRENNDAVPNDYYHRHRDKKLEYQKNYNRENDEKIKGYNKDYYLKRRAEILEKAKTRVICECGCDVQLSNMNAHKKTKKHLKRVVTVGCVDDSSSN